MNMVELGSILHLTKGKKPVHQSDSAQDGYLPYVDIKAFETGQINSFTDGEKCILCKARDVLIVCDGARSGLVGRAMTGYVGSTLAKVTAEGLNNDYLFYFIQGKYALLNTKMKGTGTPHLNVEELKKQKLVIPDKKEQERIVAKIEELFSEIDKAEETLNRAKAQLTVYRQAVLKDAFTGNFTHEWKKRQGISEPWASVSITQLVESDKHALKAGPFGSALKKEFYTKHGYKIYGQEQVINGDENIGDYYISEDKFKELISCRVKPGDILISLVGTVGKVMILSNNAVDGIINPRLIKISLDKTKMLPQFFKYFFESDYLKRQYMHMTHGATMDVLNLGMIKQLSFPKCPIEEQTQVIKEIESRLTMCKSIEKNIEITLQQAQSLRQSILKQAFEGKLV